MRDALMFMAAIVLFMVGVSMLIVIKIALYFKAFFLSSKS